jgi:hypothetical protein
MKQVLFWVLAIFITLAAAVYQRKTGPTYDKKVKVTMDGQLYKFKLIRSHETEKDCPVQFIIADKAVTGTVEYRRYPTNDGWTKIEMVRTEDKLEAALPHLPMAGKYEYKVELQKEGKSYKLNDGNPVLIRFKGAVPSAILSIHIFFMFFAMLLGNLSGILALFNRPKFRFYTTLTTVCLLIGGLIFGPWVQLYAFGEAWAGVPFAWDLTDNKTLIAFIFWVLAWLMNRKKERPVYPVIAAIVMLLVYSIPHSMYGSQLDPNTGKIIQGFITLF